MLQFNFNFREKLGGRMLSVLNTHFIILFSMDFICFGDNYKCFKAVNSKLSFLCLGH